MFASGTRAFLVHGDVTGRKWHKARARIGQGKQGRGRTRRWHNKLEKKRSGKDGLGNARSCVVLSQRPHGHGCDANATSYSRRAMTADGKPGRGGQAWVKTVRGPRVVPLVVERRARIRNATFGPRACAQTCGKGCPKVFDIMPQRANLVANGIVRRRLCPKRYGMARLIYG